MLYVEIAILLWFVASCASWFALLQDDYFEEGRFAKLKLLTFLFLTLPFFLFLLLVVLLQVVREKFQERREIKRRKEEAKYGVFERKVLVEKYCNHIWENDSIHMRQAVRKKFSCIKCRQQVLMNIEEYNRMYEKGMMANGWSTYGTRRVHYF